MSEDARYGGEDVAVADKYFASKTWIKNSYKIRVHRGGRDNLYSQLRIPRDLADKYSLNQECVVEVIDREDLGGILIKKSS